MAFACGGSRHSRRGGLGAGIDCLVRERLSALGRSPQCSIREYCGPCGQYHHHRLASVGVGPAAPVKSHVRDPQLLALSHPSVVDPNAKSSRQQLLCNCRPACGEDRAFEDDGEARVWFEPLDCREQQCGDEDDRRSIKKLARRSSTSRRPTIPHPERSRPCQNDPGLSRPQVNPSYSALHRAGADAVQELISGLTAPCSGFEIKKGDPSFSNSKRSTSVIRVPSEERCVKSINPSLSIHPPPYKNEAPCLPSLKNSGVPVKIFLPVTASSCPTPNGIPP